MSASITVAVRVRPPTDWERERLPNDDNKDTLFLGDGSLAAPSSPTKLSSKSLRPIIQVMDDKVLVFDPKDQDARRAFEQRGFVPPGTKRYKDMRYAFDRVFREDARQVDVYEGTTRPLLDGVLDGFNATVFAYGATGCGKTHTISGTEDDPGIIYQTMSELFQRIEDKREEILCEVSLSFLEIYNEEIRDLLYEGDIPQPRGGLAMREDQSTRVTVAGLTEMHPINADEVKAMVMQGNSRRTQSPTHANQTSSRSHAVLQVNVTQTPRTAGTTELRTMATLSIIDLAGSERASATMNMGQRMIEGANINKSLLALGNVINALCASGNRTRHIPYRNSKLTRLLRFSLGGNCKTVMIVCVAPTSAHFEDTQNTLKYANRAKEIKTKISRNFINVDRHVGQYVEAINRLNEEVASLKAKLAGKAGVEAEVQRRKKAEAKAELARVKSDLQAKADQTRKTLVDGAACEAHVAAANSRLNYIRARLAELDSSSTTEPLSADATAERALLLALASGDEELLLPSGAAQRQLQKSSNSDAMFDATLRAVTERKSDRIDESAADIIRADASATRAEMDKVRAEARENVLRIALDEQSKFAAQLVGLLARCTVMMGNGSHTLLEAFPSSTGEDVSSDTAARARQVAEAMARVAKGNDEIFESLIGATTESFQNARDSALLKFTAHSPVKVTNGRPMSRTSLGGSRSSKPSSSVVRPVSAAPRRRSSLLNASHNSPRRLPAKSPRRPGARGSLSRAQVPVARLIAAAEKKSVRWRDETSHGQIDDKDLPPATKPVTGGRRSVSQPVKSLAPLILEPPKSDVSRSTTPVVMIDGKTKEKDEAEWEDERTDDNMSVSSTSSSRTTSVAGPSSSGPVHRGSIRDRLIKTSRPSPMTSVGEETEGEESPVKPKRAPLGDVVNSPPPATSQAADGSPSKKTKKASSSSSPTKSSGSSDGRPSTPTRASASSSSPSKSSRVPGSSTKSHSRRASHIGPLRAEKKSRRRSSLIPRPSPPTSSYTYSYAQPRKTPSKKRRLSALPPSEGGSISAPWVKPVRPLFSQSVTADSATGVRKPAWR